MGFFGFGRKKFTYKLVKNGRAKYIGSTNNPYRRNEEHSQKKDYDYMEVTSGRVSEREAERREARNLRSYRRATGRNPRYNKTSNGRFNKWY